MSDKISREQLNTMPIAKLEELIRSLPADCDPDFWMLVMDAYTERSEQPMPDRDESLQAFFSDYSGTAPIFADPVSVTKAERA